MPCVPASAVRDKPGWLRRTSYRLSRFRRVTCQGGRREYVPEPSVIPVGVNREALLMTVTASFHIQAVRSEALQVNLVVLPPSTQCCIPRRSHSPVLDCEYLPARWLSLFAAARAAERCHLPMAPNAGFTNSTITLSSITRDRGGGVSRSPWPSTLNPPWTSRTSTSWDQFLQERALPSKNRLRGYRLT